MPVSTEMSNAAIAVPDDLKSRLRLHRQFASEVEHEKRDIILYLPPIKDFDDFLTAGLWLYGGAALLALADFVVRSRPLPIRRPA